MPQGGCFRREAYGLFTEINPSTSLGIKKSARSAYVEEEDAFERGRCFSRRTRGSFLFAVEGAGVIQLNYE